MNDGREILDNLYMYCRNNGIYMDVKYIDTTIPNYKGVEIKIEFEYKAENIQHKKYMENYNFKASIDENHFLTYEFKSI